MADAPIDGNSRQGLIAASSVDGATPVRLYADPVTHRLLVSNSTVGAGFQQPTGTVNGTNAIFVFPATPNVVCVDHQPFQKVSSDGTVNWTGTTTITLSVAPVTDVFGID